ncbi:Homeobox protein ceh-63 [Caenorhabditis elegans]|nr:Homeobox protein ceh-63 [Caenorhabditis elegans]CTQ87023.1 Homeobox protein ceh-63 [Caenorhabditis elegans]|eukprot:NP_001300312.1 C. Elegans Homeobox [Caenorhabditis elegans]
MMKKSDERSPSPQNPSSQHVQNLQTFFHSWPSHFAYSLPSDQQNNV